jgi:hypothetical protein
MKMTLEKLRSMDESKMADDDHPFREDITSEEFIELLNEIAKETIKVKPLNPTTAEEWHVTQEAIIAAMNSPKNSC